MGLQEVRIVRITCDELGCDARDSFQVPDVDGVDFCGFGASAARKEGWYYDRHDGLTLCPEHSKPKVEWPIEEWRDHGLFAIGSGFVHIADCWEWKVSGGEAGILLCGSNEIIHLNRIRSVRENCGDVPICPACVEEFKKRYPEVRVTAQNPSPNWIRLSFGKGTFDKLEFHLLEEHCDLLLRIFRAAATVLPFKLTVEDKRNEG